MRKKGRTARKPPRRRRSGAPTSARVLQYKVVEVSTVDEGSLEFTVNTWVAQGWTLENVQFAMRESSKRPAMAFVFFTRPGVAAEVAPEVLVSAVSSRSADAWSRLAALAAEGDEP
jgi:hypothetical protein